MKVAITGSIACGKSTVSNYLINKGYNVVDADKIGHNILLEEAVKKEILNIFSADVFENGEIDRKKLGEVVFQNNEKLKQLNAITHPIIKKQIELVMLNKKLVFLDIALLFEGDFVDLVDKVIVVHINKEEQLKRLMKRNNFSYDQAIARISSQMDSEEKVKLADYVIDNSGTIEETHNQIEKILIKLEEEINGIRN